MQLSAKHTVPDEGQCNITVSVPPTRSDVLHPCDVMEVLYLYICITVMATICHSLFMYMPFFLFALRMWQLLMDIITFQKESLHL